MKKIFLFLSIFCSISAVSGESIDLKILKKVNTPFNPPADHAWNTITDLNTPVCILTPATLFIAGQINHDKGMVNKSYQLASSIIIAGIVTWSTKVIVKRDRPYETYPDDIYRKANVSGYSFPSGHTSTAFALATSLTLNFPKWYVIVPAYVYAGTIAYSRMYLGVHYPSDVLGGMVLGAGSAYLSYKINYWISKKR